MAKVHVCNVQVHDNPTKFLSNFEFEITFECLENLPEDLEWKIIYVGSAESEEFDQTLDTVYVGPVPEGRHKFVFTADPPSPAKIPVADVVGVTVILLTCAYKGQEFIRVGYYVNIEYDDPELVENPPEKPIYEKLGRSILASNPRVTKFKINWDDAKANGESSTNGDGAGPSTSSGSAMSPLEDDENLPACPKDVLPANREKMCDSPLKTGLVSSSAPPPLAENNSNSGMMDMD